MSWYIDDRNIDEHPLVPSFLIYGDSGDGKTTLLGEYAESVFVREARAGKPKRKTRLYTRDPGGWEPIRPLVRQGIISIVDLTEIPNPLEWIQHVTLGRIPTGVNPFGGPIWGRDAQKDAETALYAFEGMKAFADVAMQFASDEANEGRNIGGEPPAFKFTAGAGPDAVKWAGNSRSHYGSIQTVMNIAIQQSLRLPGEVWWSSMARRSPDLDTTNPVIGPEVAGKGLTSDLPRLFTYTFRAMAFPSDALTNKPTEHRLYIEDHQEQNTAGAKCLGNNRLPLDADPLAPYVSPASVVKALELIATGQGQAFEKIRARVAAALGAGQARSA